MKKYFEIPGKLLTRFNCTNFEKFSRKNNQKADEFVEGPIRRLNPWGMARALGQEKHWQRQGTPVRHLREQLDDPD